MEGGARGEGTCVVINNENAAGSDMLGESLVDIRQWSFSHLAACRIVVLQCDRDVALQIESERAEIRHR